MNPPSAFATWVRADVPILEHSFYNFRRRFQLHTAQTACLRIAAESDYVFFLDGVEVLRGQYQAYPEQRYYSEFSWDVAAGTHTIAIQLYYCGRNFQTCVAAPEPGMWLELEFPDGTRVVSDAGFRARRDPAMLRNRLDCVDNQIGMVIGCDARLADDWRTADYDDTAWRPAVPATAFHSSVLKKRPTADLQTGPFKPACVIRRAGLFRNPANDDGQRTYAEVAMLDQFDAPENHANGTVLVGDLGSEEAGLLELRVRGARPGVVIDLAHGEHLNADGFVDRMVGARNFTDRYITSAAPEQSYTLSRRAGARFIQLDIAGPLPENIEFGIRPRTLPLPPAAEFEDGSSQTAVLRKASIHTLALCMHEHYEDCPWREQALYGFDSRQQMLFGYQVWGNYDYVEANLNLLGDSVLDNDLAAICAPSTLTPQIPLFSLIWIVALAEHLRYAGHDRAWRRNRAVALRVTGRLTADFDEASGLYRNPSGNAVWNFYEWSAGLDGLGDSGDCTDFSHLGKAPGKLEAPFNLYLIELFEALAALTGEAAWQTRADELRGAVMTRFFDASTHTLRTRDDETRRHEMVQVLALLHRAVPAGERAAVWRHIRENDCIPMTLSPLYYLVKLVGEQGVPEDPTAAAYLNERLRTLFLPMAQSVPGTMWETEKGAADFDGAGSLCHGWSALPVYVQAAVVMGVRPLTPGFERILIASALEGPAAFRGALPTPRGPVEMEFRRATTCAQGRIQLTIPENTEVVWAETLRDYEHIVRVRRCR